MQPTPVNGQMLRLMRFRSKTCHDVVIPKQTGHSVGNKKSRERYHLLHKDTDQEKKKTEQIGKKNLAFWIWYSIKFSTGMEGRRRGTFITLRAVIEQSHVQRWHPQPEGDRDLNQNDTAAQVFSFIFANTTFKWTSLSQSKILLLKQIHKHLQLHIIEQSIKCLPKTESNATSNSRHEKPDI